MKESGLAQALRDLEAVLKEEASAPASEDLASRKEAAVARLQALLQSGASLLDGDLDANAQQLRELLMANRFSLKWGGLRVRLARLMQPKPSVEAPRPRLDLVH